MKNRIILTGASGFVGQYLKEYLALKNVEIILLSRDQLNGVLKLPEAESIVHLAGKAHDLKATSDVNEYYKINFELTQKIYDAFIVSDVKTFFFVSSVKAVADTVENVLTEECTPDPKTHYGKSKLMAEKYIGAQNIPFNKKYYILRPCMIHGPGNKGNLNLLYQFVKKGLPYPLAAFKNNRSFLSVENLCFVLYNLMIKDIPSGIYNVSDDVALSTNEVVGILANAMHKKPNLWLIPKKTILLIAKIGDFLKLPINTERLNKLTENYVVSNLKLKTALNIELPLTSLEGLEHTAKSFNHN